MKANIHFTGILLDWIYKNRKELFEKLKTLIKNNQVEILTGGFYEPVMPLIPYSDRVGQIKKQTDFINRTLDYTPTGMWLAERVWEQGIVGALVDAGIKYVVLDDSHFMSVGISPENLKGYFTTEDQGKMIKLVPIDKKSRYLIPFSPHEDVMKYFLENADESGKTFLTSADDGEKFGDWPGTYNSVYEKGWLCDFFQMLHDNRDWINVRTFSDYTQNFKSNGLIYLNNASYSEMMEWALPAVMQEDLDIYRKDFKSKGIENKFNLYFGKGYFRNFQFKYPESNIMHKKMLNVHEKVNEMTEGKEKTAALDHLWAGQCNCPYWHGVFGGLYLPHLRHAIFENLIQAEKIADKSKYKDNMSKIEKKDINLDGNNELIMDNRFLSLYFDIEKGGGIFEEDVKDINYNLLNTLSRYEEFYHKKLKRLIDEGKISYDPTDSEDKVVIKEPGLENLLCFDWYKRMSLVDHFFHEDTDVHKVMNLKYGEQGDFVIEPFEYDINVDKSGNQNLKLSRDGGVWVDGIFEKVRVTKNIMLKDRSLVIDYTIKNLADKKIHLWHGVEFILSMLGGHSEDRYYTVGGKKPQDYYADAVLSYNEIKEITMNDDYNKYSYEFTSDQYMNVWTYPIQTVSLSEAGFEKNYQSSVIMYNQKFSIDRDEEHKFRIIKNIIKK
jgi:alpha-amylase